MNALCSKSGRIAKRGWTLLTDGCTLLSGHLYYYEFARTTASSVLSTARTPLAAAMALLSNTSASVQLEARKEVSTWCVALSHGRGGGVLLLTNTKRWLKWL